MISHQTYEQNKDEITRLNYRVEVLSNCWEETKGSVQQLQKRNLKLIRQVAGLMSQRDELQRQVEELQRHLNPPIEELDKLP